jgi:hypothetical protein
MDSGISYTVSARCDAPADTAFDFLSDGLALGGWALGCFTTEPLADGIFQGRAIDTGELVYVRPLPDRERGVIVFEVGLDPNELSPWIWAIVHPCNRFGGAPGTSVVTMIAWRPEGTTDDAWNVVLREHDIEILFIKAQIERRHNA